MLLSSCPAQARWRLDNPEACEPTRAMDLGSLVDQLVFGGASFHTINADSYRTKAAQTERDAARERGQIPVLEHEIEPAQRLAGRIRATLLEEGVELEKCQKQQHMEWESPVGIISNNGRPTPCAGTPDLAILRAREWITIDLKVGGKIDPEYLDRHVCDQYWDVQAAAYQEAGHTLYHTDGRGGHFLLCAETSGAQMVEIYPFSESMMELGRRRWARAQYLWNHCRNNNEWPGYKRRDLVPPDWLYERETSSNSKFQQEARQ